MLQTILRPPYSAGNATLSLRSTLCSPEGKAIVISISKEIRSWLHQSAEETVLRRIASASEVADNRDALFSEEVMLADTGPADHAESLIAMFFRSSPRLGEPARHATNLTISRVPLESGSVSGGDRRLSHLRHSHGLWNGRLSRGSMIL